MEEKKYLILAYYNFTQIPDPHHEVLEHKNFFKDRDVTGRIYISHEGINGQMSGSSKDASAYIDWIQTHPHFKGTKFKLHAHHENVFPRMTVKFRKQLVALDLPVNLNKRGESVSPQQWKEMLEKESKYVLLDVRNDYEWAIGHFDGAELPPVENFREFNEYAEKLKDQINTSETPVMMYCTGGIRCELFSSLLKEKGFEKVFQLDGGIINYGLQEGSKHWKGKLFVFDDRLSIPISEEKNETISSCRHCGTKNDTYYNCANMDCNALFLCCLSCLREHQGCCQPSCQQAPRLRQFKESHKPFRRKHILEES